MLPGVTGFFVMSVTFKQALSVGPQVVFALTHIKPPLNFEENFNVIHGALVAPIAETPVGKTQSYDNAFGFGFAQ